MGARTSRGLGAGAIAGIVIAIILIVLITIDLFCCFFNSCGIIFCCHQAICGGGGGVKSGKDDCKYAEFNGLICSPIKSRIHSYKLPPHPPYPVINRTLPLSKQLAKQLTSTRFCVNERKIFIESNYFG